MYSCGLYHYLIVRSDHDSPHDVPSGLCAVFLVDRRPEFLTIALSRLHVRSSSGPAIFDVDIQPSVASSFQRCAAEAGVRTW